MTTPLHQRAQWPTPTRTRKGTGANLHFCACHAVIRCPTHSHCGAALSPTGSVGSLWRDRGSASTRKSWSPSSPTHGGRVRGDTVESEGAQECPSPACKGRPRGEQERGCPALQPGDVRRGSQSASSKEKTHPFSGSNETGPSPLFS